ncbi:MAG: 2-oxoglutarate dehydrogenase complex dihydrolipoyllysine-residue succinyltransferase [Geminicoccaceae bacterium]|nr:2-oxoglutarate dehydrogenase complex dihydrolipoyllysine-residue succinyltransferase [Geminicoccaceae bacterium]
MSVEIKVPTLGESVTEATVARWMKKAGDAVAVDEPVVELETDKVSLEVPSPVAGMIEEILVEEGSDVEVGALLGRIKEGAAGAAAPAPAPEPEPATAAGAESSAASSSSGGVGPAARKIADEKGVDLAKVSGTGPKGNVTKGDVLQASASPAATSASGKAAAPVVSGGGREDRVKMTRLRKRIAERLKEAQNTAAMLTTFNEVDMTAVMELRSRYQDSFVKKHGIKLGFMSFFVKACVDALRAYPAVNAEIDGDEIVYKHFYDIGVAVSSSSGLVVPVVRGADRLGLAGIEESIADLGTRARDGKLSMEELNGGTFTITNGGIFGSMMSTPILNPPQVGILGMHNIVQRAMVMPSGEIKARPMMYLALSYDHRIIDGKEAVSFLVRVKQCIEDPQRMLIDA